MTKLGWLFLYEATITRIFPKKAENGADKSLKQASKILAYKEVREFCETELKAFRCAIIRLFYSSGIDAGVLLSSATGASPSLLTILPARTSLISSPLSVSYSISACDSFSQSSLCSVNSLVAP